jgi:hypothetical protein
VIRKLSTGLALLIAAILMIATPVGAKRIILNTIGATAALIGNGHVAKGTVFLDCTAGEQIQFTLTLTQDGVSGTGHGAGVCTGSLTGYAVTVPAEGDRFTAGTAAACATAVNRDRGVVVDTRQWCRAAGVALSAP